MGNTAFHVGLGFSAVTIAMLCITALMPKGKKKSWLYWLTGAVSMWACVPYAISWTLSTESVLGLGVFLVIIHLLMGAKCRINAGPHPWRQ